MRNSVGFSSSLNHPIRFLPGGNQVTDGMDEAVTGMRIPPLSQQRDRKMHESGITHPAPGLCRDNNVLFVFATPVRAE